MRTLVSTGSRSTAFKEIFPGGFFPGGFLSGELYPVTGPNTYTRTHNIHTNIHTHTQMYTDVPQKRHTENIVELSRMGIAI